MVCWPRNVLITCCCLLCVSAAGAEEKVDFSRDIRPILSNACFRCHGPDAAAREAELRLDIPAGAFAKRKGKAAIVAGHPQRSELMRRISHADPDQRMPPKESNRNLTAKEIDLVRRWIEQGAPWQQHWAFQPLVQPALPKLAEDAWPKNPVDQFVLRRLRSEGLTPAPQAPAETLVRRVAFDLTGLPPTIEEIDRFVEDKSPRAYEKMVDRYLQSTAYGEQMARHWLDLARYADTNGYQYDTERTQWVWRDWVIAAYNRNLPFDQFTIEQLAGDLLPKGTAQQRLATGFNRNHGITIEGGVIDEEYRVEYVMDRLVTVGSVWMGLTVGCARCHAHKFDPFSSRDYYALAGIFKSTRSMLGYRVDSKFNLTALGSLAENKLLSQLEQQMDVADDVLVNGNKLNMSAEKRKQHTDQLNAAYAKMEKIPAAMVVEEGQVADMPVLLRGNHLTPARQVARGVPRILSTGLPFKVSAGESGRRNLAHWLTDPRHSLTARVMVNRIWCWHMGAGIVRSVDNFGRLGERPDNQPLLDWLALRFIDSNWSIKEMHRLMMNTSTYQMSSRTDLQARRQDPDNRLLWRMNPRRLEAEEIRDSLLMLGNHLDLAMGGRMLPVRNHKIMNTEEIESCNAVHDQPRRTVYLPVIRSGLHEFLKTFDFPDPSVPVGQRNVTTVAPQALFLMNSTMANESCQRIAKILLARQDMNSRQRIQYAYQLILARSASAAELNQWSGFVQQRKDQVIAARVPADQQLLETWISVVRVFLSSNEFIYVQ